MPKKKSIKDKLHTNIQSAFSEMDPYTFDDWDILEEKIERILSHTQLTPFDQESIVRCCMETTYLNKIDIEAYINTTLQSVIPDLKAQLLAELKADLLKNKQLKK